MNFSSEEFKFELRRALMAIRPRHKVDDTQFAIRCPLCGDSKTDKRKTRFYIKIHMEEEMPIFYYCFNCWEAGIFTPTLLKLLDLDSIEMVSGLRALNKRVSRINKKYNFKIEKVSITIPIPDEEEENILIKKKYMEDRIGRSFSMEELNRLKVVFNLGHLLVHNNITNLSCHPDKALELDEKYVGFLTTNNEMLNMRQVLPSKLKRYEKYVFERDKINFLKFYTIPTTVDLFTDDTIEINLTEGVFDAWGIYYNLHDGGKKNSIYSAACGADYASLIEYFIKEGFIGNVILNIYKDVDQDVDILKDLKEKYGVWFKKFNVYSNTKGKDFGVPADQIEVIRHSSI